jgi:hypothetical protein
VIRKDAERTPVAGGPASPEPVEMFETAIADVAELTLGLASAIAEHAYEDGAQLRGELEGALCRAQVYAEHIPNGSQRSKALRQLGDMHAVTNRTLMIAPAPSVTAIEAAEAGDPSAWNQERQVWIAGRRASGSNPRVPPERGETRPESTKAFRDTSCDARGVGGAISGPAIAPRHAPDKADKR